MLRLLFKKKQYETQKKEVDTFFDKVDISYHKCLGKGAFGEVWNVNFNLKDFSIKQDNVFNRLSFCGKHWAMKVVSLSRLKEDDRDLIRNEKCIWETLSHPNILKLEHFFESKNTMYFVSELMEETLLDVHERMHRLGAKPKSITICNFLIPVASAMTYMHSLELIHRDVKSENILLTNQGETIKLSDFGLSRVVRGKEMTFETGSYRWMAPEMIRHERYDHKCDVFSFAMLMYETITLSVPFSMFSPVEAAFEVARFGRRPIIPPTTKDFEALIEDCWRQDATLRPEFGEIETRLSNILVKKESFGSFETRFGSIVRKSQLTID